MLLEGNKLPRAGKIMHKYKGYCFVDFAASAPYVEMNMHPDDKEERLDAIYFHLINF